MDPASLERYRPYLHLLARLRLGRWLRGKLDASDVVQQTKAVSPPLPHQREVVHASFSPDGRHVASASKDQTAQVWDAATGKPVSPPLRHQGEVNYAVFSSDNRRVLTASGDGARVWEAATGKPASPPLRDPGAVYAAFSPDGRHVLTVSEGARVWEAFTGQPISPPLRHQDRVVHAAFSPDGSRVLSVGWHGEQRVWDLTPDDRPWEDWLALAQLWSIRRIDTAGGLIQLTPEEFADAWNKLRRRYPRDFTVTAGQAFAWHWREMGDCLRARNPAAAVFHAWQATPEWHFLWAALHP